ncbi:GNAT family N-acetyltransferase [Nocardioides sp.]|uniref:GNAT family N-acetyltransferase n=1 Tax=Nocardioides sp. TaxID=35761 RepID=UPI00356339F1
MLISVADPAQYEAMIAMAVERNQHQTESDAGWQLMVPQTWPDLVALVATDGDGAIAGWGYLATRVHMPPGWTSLWLTVGLEAEGQGLGRRLYDGLLEHRKQATTLLRSTVFDDEDRALAIAQHWGFEIDELSIESALELRDLPTPDLPPGVTLEVRPDLNFADQDAVDAMLLASQTNPEALTGHVVTCPGLVATSAGAISLGILARVDGVPAGIVHGTVVDEDLFIGYTGVDPRARGRGLAKLLKQRAHLEAAAAGATLSVTQNEENNHGIRRVNAELGYVVRHGTYRMRRPL